MNNLTPKKYGLTKLECQVLDMLGEGYTYTKKFGATVLDIMRAMRLTYNEPEYDSLAIYTVEDALCVLMCLGLVERMPRTPFMGWRLTDDGKLMVGAIRAMEDKNKHKSWAMVCRMWTRIVKKIQRRWG